MEGGFIGLSMENNIPQNINDKRRKSLNKYTFLALLVYHIPTVTSYLAKYIGLARYQYADLNFTYILILLSYMVFFLIIKIKDQITIRFIYNMLYAEIIVNLLITTYIFYVMQDLRYMTLIACLLALSFVYIQSSLFVSFIVVSVVVIDYLMVSYLGIYKMGQSGNFFSDLLIILIFLPVSLFIGYMSNLLQNQKKEIKQSRDKLKSTYETLASYNQRMIDSLHYAEMIQKSLLPGLDRMKTESPDSLIIWMPKDIVGGDIFYMFSYSESSVIALIDCTGHGVPGAFLTMIAYTEIRKIILEQGCHDPAEILKRLNLSMKNVLHKGKEKQMVDDGLDAAVIEVNHTKSCFRFAGARIPLFFIKDGQVVMVKGDKQSIGYMSSDENHIFTNHTVTHDGHCWAYLKTDGYTDQLGGENRQRFGTKQFKTLIAETYQEPFSIQRKIFLKALFDHQGSNDQVDDITVIGLKFT